MSLRVFCVRACIAACCRSGIKHLCAALAVISYTHTVLYCVYTNTSCVMFSDVLAVVFRLCIDVSFVCVTYSHLCKRQCVCLCVCDVVYSLTVMQVSVCVCVCVVITQPSVGALMSKCTLLSLLLGFM